MPSGSGFDAIVVGLGAMGSSAAFHVARRGSRVLGLDRYAPPHDRGSSHGQSRIIREAYFEHPAYVPLVRRAYELWQELPRPGAEPLLRPTGGLMIGPPGGTLVAGALRSARAHRLAHEILSAGEIRRRFPALHPGDGTVAVWEPRAGVLDPERCISTHLERAREHGADLRFDEAVVGWSADGAGVRVTTAKGAYLADRLVLAAGGWIGSLLGRAERCFQVERQVLLWFAPRARPERFTPERCPVYLWEHDEGRYFYGFPDLGSGVKVAIHHEGESANPDEVLREVDPGEVEAMRRLLARFVPDAAGALRATAVCLYTNTPDGHFLLDRHPEHPRVLIVSPCSGHGFKFASAIGELVAAWSRDEEAPFDLTLFRARPGGDRW